MAAGGHTDPQQRWILHFTHARNLPSIVRSGLLVCDAKAQCGLVVTDVGDAEIKEARRRRGIPIPPGGRVDDYVPFYFAPRSPMLYRLARDHRDGVPGRYADGDRPLVYLAARVGAMVGAGLPWIATDGNAANATTEFCADLRTLDTMVDWPLMLEKMWHNIRATPTASVAGWQNSWCTGRFR